MKKYLKNTNKGITLIALVITIIVLLILAGVTIAMLMGDNGILTKATEAKNDQADATVEEAIALLWNEYQLEIKSSSNEEVKESTKIASTEITTIQGEKANYLAITATSFWDFLLTDKEVIDADGIVNVRKLTGQTLDRGNGTDGATDVYKIEEEEDIYTLKYCGANSEEIILWEVSEVSSETTYPEATPEDMFYYRDTDDGNIEIYALKNKGWDGSVYSLPEEYTLPSQPLLYSLPEELSGNIVISKTIDNKPVVSLACGEAFLTGIENLNTVTIPYSVREISDYFFGGSNNLTTISFPEGKNPELEIPADKWGAPASVKKIRKNGEILQ